MLEVGCGIGGMLELMRRVCAGGKVFGLDLALAGVAFTSGRTRLPVLQADVTRPPFGVDFDIICLFDVLEHVAPDELVLSRLFGMLASGGALVLTVPASPALWSYYDEAVGHHRRYSKAELAGKLAAAGFEVEYLTPYMIVLMPVIYLKRWLSGLVDRGRRRGLRGQRGRWGQGGQRAPLGWLGLRSGQGGGGERTTDELQRLALADLAPLHPVVNRLASLLLAVEPGLIDRRRRLPFGSSLLAVARRPG